MAEQWRPVIEPFDDSYEVSDLGNVESISRLAAARPNGDGKPSERRLPRRPIKPRLRGNALVVNLWRDGRAHEVRVKDLVLWAFVGACPPFHEARCLSGDETDCSLTNVAWKPKHRSAQDG